MSKIPLTAIQWSPDSIVAHTEETLDMNPLCLWGQLSSLVRLRPAPSLLSSLGGALSNLAHGFSATKELSEDQSPAPAPMRESSLC